jgi:putative hydroxymethylpyrimidine transport system substrate-binding protein
MAHRNAWAAAAVLLVACLAAAILWGVFFPPQDRHPTIRVALDFFPNPNHVPLYAAIDQGFFARRGIRVEIVPPSDPSQVVRLAATQVVDVALTPQINFLIAKDAGLPLIAVAALIDRSLGGLLSLKEVGVQTLSDLRGKRIGYSLVPLEPALWKTVLACAGFSLDDVEMVNVGMNTMSALLLHQVDAIGAFRNFEPFQVELQGGQPVFFPQEEHCVPETYELIGVVNPARFEERRAELRAFVDGLAEGIAYTQAHPDAAFSAFVQARPDLDDELNRRSFAATLPLYAARASLSNPAQWERMQDYLLSSGLVSRKRPLTELYADQLTPDR